MSNTIQVGKPPPVSPEVRARLAKDDLGPVILGVTVAFTGVAFIAVSLRCYTRVRLIKSFGKEDWLMVVSMLLTVGHCIAQSIAVHYGSGKHLALITLENSIGIRKCLYASIITFSASLACTKLSILLQYYGLFPGRMRIAIYLSMAICAGAGIASILTSAFTCIPVSAFWMVMLKPTAKCINEDNFYYAAACIGLATDILVAILPMRPIWKLQMRKRQKISLMTLLSLGLVVCIISAVRLESLVKLHYNRNDATYYSAAPHYWAAIELNLAIVCGSAPALKPLVVLVVPKFTTFGSSGSSSLPRFTKPTAATHHGSFIELHDKGNLVATDKELKDKELHALTALPAIGKESFSAARGAGADYDHKSMAPSESSSQNNLVHTSTAVV